jgi:hypothetical protein
MLTGVEHAHQQAIHSTTELKARQISRFARELPFASPVGSTVSQSHLEHTMKYAIIVAAAACICTAMPASAEEVGVGVGPVGVTVGTGHDRDRDGDRDRTVIRERDEHRDRDTVIINKDRD